MRWYFHLQADSTNDDRAVDGSLGLLAHSWGSHLWTAPRGKKVHLICTEPSRLDSQAEHKFFALYQLFQDVDVSNPAWLFGPWHPLDGGKLDNWHYQGPDDHIAGDVNVLVLVLFFSFQDEVVNVKVPRFQIEATRNLDEEIRSLGVEAIFTPGVADFTNMVRRNLINLSQFRHR